MDCRQRLSSFGSSTRCRLLRPGATTLVLRITQALRLRGGLWSAARFGARNGLRMRHRANRAEQFTARTVSRTRMRSVGHGNRMSRLVTGVDSFLLLRSYNRVHFGSLTLADLADLLCTLLR